MPPTKKHGPIEVAKFSRGYIEVPIRGITGYIPHKHNEAELDKMERKRKGLPVGPKPKLDPFKNLLGSLYIMPGAEKKVARLKGLETGQSWKFQKGLFGIPAVAFKAAMIRGAKLAGLVMTDVKVSFFVKGVYGVGHDLVPLRKYTRSFMRRDPKPVGTGMDLRYRMEFEGWQAVLPISYNESMLSKEKIVTLVQHAGFVGVGDDRPSTKTAAGMEKGIFEVCL